MTNREYLGSMSIDDMFVAMLRDVANEECMANCLAEFIAGKMISCKTGGSSCKKCVKKVLDMENRRKCNE